MFFFDRSVWDFWKLGAAVDRPGVRPELGCVGCLGGSGGPPLPPLPPLSPTRECLGGRATEARWTPPHSNVHTGGPLLYQICLARGQSRKWSEKAGHQETFFSFGGALGGASNVNTSGSPFPCPQATDLQPILYMSYWRCNYGKYTFFAIQPEVTVRCVNIWKYRHRPTDVISLVFHTDEGK